MKFSHFKHCSYSETIRVMPQNYLLMICRSDCPQRYIDFDHAISDEILLKVIQTLKDKGDCGYSHKSIVNNLNDAFDKRQCVLCGEFYDKHDHKELGNWCKSCIADKRTEGVISHD